MDNTKLYLKVYEQVREDIIKGRYPVGKKLPSKRVMAEAMGMSVITIEHAYELLSEEGYIAAREKSGYFVTFDDKDIYVGVNSYSARSNDDIDNGNGSKDRRFASRNAINNERIAGGNHADKGQKAREGNSNKTEASRSTSDFAIVQQTSPTAGQFSVSHNPDEPKFSYSIYAKTVRRVLSEYDNYIMKKSPKQGMTELRSAIADYLLRSRRLSISPEQIIIGAGAEYLYGLIVQTFGRDCVYGVESPSYQKIAKVYAAFGAELKMLPLGKDGIESDELWQSDIKLLHITPYRSFPSGVTASASKKREYLKWSRQSDGYIVEDDFESEFTPSRKPEETIFSLDEEGRVIYVNTFTRTIGSYVRCAYMVLPTDLIDVFTEKIGFYECPVPTLDQLVVASLIESGDFERHINKVRRFNRTTLN